MVSGSMHSPTLGMVLAGQSLAGAEPAELLEMFMELLDQHGDALVASFGADGLVVPMPPSVPIGAHHVVDVRSPLDLVAFADKVRVIAAWERVRVDGGASVIVHLVNDPAQPVLLFAVDARERHGVHLALVVPATPASPGISPAAAVMRIAPRTARVRKDMLAMIVEIDAATTKMLGWRPEQMVGRRSLEFVHPEDQDRSISNWMEMLSSPGQEQRVRLRHLTADGGWMWIEITNQNRLEDPHHACVLTEMLDISEELAAQEALRASEQLLRRLAESLPQGVVQLDPDRGIVYANERLSVITGASTAATLAEQFRWMLAADAPAFDAAIENVLARGHDQDLRVRFQLDPAVDASGGMRHCTISMRSLTNDAGGITGAVLSVADVSDQVRLTAELEQRATFDPLTGCYNRQSVISHLEARLRNPGTGVSIVFVDLDGFKEVNDEFGHAAGDELLAQVGDRLRSAVRDTDIVGRVGGDEFLVVCADVAHLAAAEGITEAIHRAFEPGFSVGGDRRQKVRASLGVAQTCDSTTSSDRLVAEADTRMYVDKRERRQRVRRSADVQGLTDDAAPSAE